MLNKSLKFGYFHFGALAGLFLFLTGTYANYLIATAGNFNWGAAFILGGLAYFIYKFFIPITMIIFICLIGINLFIPNSKSDKNTDASHSSLAQFLPFITALLFVFELPFVLLFLWDTNIDVLWVLLIISTANLIKYIIQNKAKPKFFPLIIIFILILTVYKISIPVTEYINAPGVWTIAKTKTDFHTLYSAKAGNYNILGNKSSILLYDLNKDTIIRKINTNAGDSLGEPVELQDGRIYFYGIKDKNNNYVSAKIYDYKNNTFKDVKDMQQKFRLPTNAILLKNGNVLIFNADGIEIYNPQKDEYTFAGKSKNRIPVDIFAKLPNGEILMGNSLYYIVYNEENDVFKKFELPNLELPKQKIWFPSSTQSYDITFIDNENALILKKGIIYNFKNNTIKEIKNKIEEDLTSASTALLDNGNVLITAGYKKEYPLIKLKKPYYTGQPRKKYKCYIYDKAKNEFIKTTSPEYPVGRPKLIKSNGKIIFEEGHSNIDFSIKNTFPHGCIQIYTPKNKNAKL